MKDKGQELLEKLWESLSDEAEERVKIPVATVSEELRKHYLMWREEQEDIEEQVKAKMQLLKSKMERELAEEFEEDFLNNKLQKRIIWRQIRREINIVDENIDLNIDPQTGVISQWVTTNEPRN